jgi:hypothetical protein
MEPGLKAKDLIQAEDLVSAKKYLGKNYCRNLAKEWANAGNREVEKEEGNV